MRTVNVRLAVILLVTVVVVVGGIEGLRRFQVWRKADFFLAQAEAAVERAELANDTGSPHEALAAYEEAQKNYAWYLSLRSSASDVSEKLGLLEVELFRMTVVEGPASTPREREDTTKKAARYLEQARKRLETVVRDEGAVERTAARRTLVDIYLLLRRYMDAETHLEVLLRRSPKDAELLQLLGTCQSTVREKTDRAVDSFERAIEADPSRVEAYQQLAAVLAAPNRLNRPAEADQWMRKMIEANPESDQAHLVFGAYVADLTAIKTADEAGKRPILLNSLVPNVLSRAVDQAVSELPEDDPDIEALTDGKAVLAQAVRAGLRRYDATLALDNPLSLLLAAGRRESGREVDVDAVGRAMNQAVAALRGEEGSGNGEVLEIAVQHGTLAVAMTHALKLFADPIALTLIMREGLLDEAAGHAAKARALASQSRDALMSLWLRDFSPEEREAVREANERGILVEALKRAMSLETPDGHGENSTVFLGRAGAKSVAMGVLESVIEDRELSDEQCKTLRDHRTALLDVMRHAMRDCEPASSDRGLLLQAGEGGALARAASEVAVDKQGVLSRAAKDILGAIADRSPWGVDREVLADALSHAVAATETTDDERKILLTAVKRGTLIDVLKNVLTDSELAYVPRSELTQNGHSRVLSHAVRRAVDSAEQNLESRDAMAILLSVRFALSKGDMDRARDFAEQGIASYPAEPRMYSILAEVAMRGRQQEETLAALERGLKATNAPTLLWAKAERLVELDRIQEARVAFRDLHEIAYPEAAVAHLQARAEFQLEHWRTALSGKPRETLFLGGAELQVALDSGGTDKLRQEFEDQGYPLSDNVSVSAETNGRWVIVDRGGVYDVTREGQRLSVAREASPGFEEIRGSLAGSAELLKEADFFLGQCYAHLDNVDQEIRAYRRALDTDPFYLPARSALASALARSGRYDDALREYQQIMQTGASPQNGALLMAQLLFERNRRRPVADRNWSEVEQVLGQAEAGGAQTVFLRAELYIAQAEEQRALARQADSALPPQELLAQADALYARAERLIEAARTQDPDEVDLWAAQARLAQHKEDWVRAEALLTEAEKRLGDSVALRIARANYLADRYGGDARDELRQLAENVGGFSKDDQARLWNGLMAASDQAGDDEQSEKLCRRVAKLKPNDLHVRYLLLRLAFRSRNDEAIQQTLDEIERVEGKGPLWLYGEAIRLSQASEGPDDARLAEARKDLARARELRPSWSQIPLVLASLCEQQGDMDGALENYLQAIDLGDYSPTAIRRAVELLYSEQRFTEAGTLLGLFDKIPPELLRTAGLVDLGLGRFDEALAKAKQTVADSEDYRDHIWLGQLMQESGRRAVLEGRMDDAREDVAAAEASLRKAVELAEDVPGTWVTLIQFLAASGQMRKAEDAVAEARKKIPADERPLAIAQCYERMGRSDLAEKNYEEALAASPRDPAVAREVADFYLRRSEYSQLEPGRQTDAIVRSEAVLKRIIDKKVNSTEADIIWARRRLALVNLSRGDYLSRQKALELIDQNLAEVGTSAEDLRYKANILAADPSPERRKEAAEILENLPGSRREVAPDDAFMLWRLYLAEGEWSKASTQMTRLLATQSSQPRYVAAYVSELLNHNQMHEAELWLNQLEKIAPNSISTATLRAEWRFQRKQYDEAINLLNRFVGKADAEPADEAERARLIALALESLGQRLTALGETGMADRCLFDAETLCQKYVRAHPGREWFMVGFLTRQNRLDEALRLLESSWRDSDPALTAEACAYVLRNLSVNEEQIGRIEIIVREALDRFGRPLPLLLVMAETRAAQGQYQEAETLYREVIKRNDSAYQAMNNLAVLLSQQGIKLPEALTLINRAIDLAGPAAALLDSRAGVHLAMGQPEKALADLKTAIATEAGPIRYFHQAQAFEKNGQRREAADALQKGRELGLEERMVEPLERSAYRALVRRLQS